MEKIVEKMQEEETGVPVKTVKSFMSKIPSVFTGAELTAWIIKILQVEQSKLMIIMFICCIHLHIILHSILSTQYLTITLITEINDGFLVNLQVL